MARPEAKTITAGLQGWDADVQVNFGLIFDTPYPVPVYDDEVDLPPAANYENCLAIVAADSKLRVSDGADWKVVQYE